MDELGIRDWEIGAGGAAILLRHPTAILDLIDIQPRPMLPLATAHCNDNTTVDTSVQQHSYAAVVPSVSRKPLTRSSIIEYVQLAGIPRPWVRGQGHGCEVYVKVTHIQDGGRVTSQHSVRLAPGTSPQSPCARTYFLFYHCTSVYVGCVFFAKRFQDKLRFKTLWSRTTFVTGRPVVALSVGEPPIWVARASGFKFRVRRVNLEPVAQPHQIDKFSRLQLANLSCPPRTRLRCEVARARRRGAMRRQDTAAISDFDYTPPPLNAISGLSLVSPFPSFSWGESGLSCECMTAEEFRVLSVEVQYSGMDVHNWPCKRHAKFTAVMREIHLNLDKSTVKERAELSSVKEAMNFACSEYWNMTMTIGGSGGQGLCMLHASHMQKIALLRAGHTANTCHDVSTFYMLMLYAVLKTTRLTPRLTRFDSRWGPSQFSHVGIVPDHAAGRRALSGISLFHGSYIPALLDTYLEILDDEVSLI
ncbi:hypothetical protein PR048_019957 [Dryococelus australis]|uniref:Uncharacterized protein n=1 Tax=Dryococelus australis TaxID=614101 RepID=A0ABQ9H4X5_9NEOP|nr:hypothetical protein PR048_019957 [Dryococelus australis]